MTTEREYEVIDQYGRVVGRRKKGDGEIAADGTGLRVPMTLMDTQARAMRDAAAQLENHQLSAFADAVNGGMSLADAVAKAKGLKRIEQFDARGHRPGFATQDAGDAGEIAREARDARLRDAWRNPSAVLDRDKQERPAAPSSNATHDQSIEELIEARDQRLRDAWRK